MQVQFSRKLAVLITGAVLIIVPLFAVARISPCTSIEARSNIWHRIAQTLVHTAGACGGEQANTNAAPAPQPCAVLLVHGIYDSDAMWTNMKAAMSARGYAGRVYGVGELLIQQNGEPQKGLIPNNGDINVLRLQVKDAVTKIKDKVEQVTGVRPPCVDVVAHSMGGLVTRAYIQSPDYNNDIRRFIMLGTPNWGSPATYNLLSPLLGTLTGDSALDIARTQMWPQSSFITALNANTNFRGVQTIVIGGLDSTYDVKFRNGLGLPNIASPYMVLIVAGDGVVPLTHMKISGIPFYVSTKVAHSGTVALGYADYLEIQERVVEYLRTGVVTQSGSFYLDATTQPAGAESFMAKVGTSTAFVAPGGFLQLVVGLPARGVKDACCLIGQSVAEGYEGITSFFMGPDGTVYDNAKAAADGYKFRNSNEPGGSAMKVRFSSPGTWTYQASLSPSAPATQNMILDMFMLSERGMKTVGMTTDFVAGQSIPIRIRLVDRILDVDTPFDGAGFTATASIYTAAGVLVETIPLTLDPTKTGEFFSSWDSTGRQGEYRVKITVTGPFDLTGTYPDTVRNLPLSFYITPQPSNAPKGAGKK